MIKNPSASATIPDGSILNIKIANGTISSAKLDASLNALISAGGVAEGSITSFHIATGSILGTDICGNTITYANIANDAVTNTKIANGAITHAKLSTDCVQSHNILDGTILGTDICGNTITSFNIADGTILGTDISGLTITGSNIANATIPFSKLDNAFQSILNGLYTGVFEITCNTTTNVDFYYEDDNAEKIYLFQNEEINSNGGNPNFVAYSSLPNSFATTPFFLASDIAIDSYSLTYSSPTNGIVSHSKVGAGKIQFNITRNSQHYLELNIFIDD
jgi:hypothetical protein